MTKVAASKESAKIFQIVEKNTVFTLISAQWAKII